MTFDEILNFTNIRNVYKFSKSDIRFPKIKLSKLNEIKNIIRLREIENNERKKLLKIMYSNKSEGL